MMKFTKLICVAALLVVGGISSASAGLIGTQGFGGNGAPTVNTGDIDTATIFTIGNFATNNSQSGIFLTMPNYNLGAITFNQNVGTSFTFTNAAFGSFTSSSITVSASGPGFTNFDILGQFTQGTSPSGNGPAELALSFTQTPAGLGGAISDSGTLAVFSAAVPEPSTFALLGLGAIGLALSAARRRLATAV